MPEYMGGYLIIGCQGGGGGGFILGGGYENEVPEDTRAHGRVVGGTASLELYPGTEEAALDLL